MNSSRYKRNDTQIERYQGIASRTLSITIAGVVPSTLHLHAEEVPESNLGDVIRNEFIVLEIRASDIGRARLSGDIGLACVSTYAK
jgi:hypothetical protein